MIRQRQWQWLTLAGISLALTTSCTAAPAGTSTGAPPSAHQTVRRQRPDRVAGEYLLTVRAGTKASQIAALLAPFGPDRIEDQGRARWLVHLHKDPGLARLRTHIHGSKFVRAIQPNFLYYPAPATPGSDRFSPR